MTEKEAKKKWCPAVAIEPKYEVRKNCIASDCMMWRWRLSPNDVEWRDRKPDGYCGLAGKE